MKTERPIRIACLGDSHTKGQFGYNWVKDLYADPCFKDCTFGNFGVNGDLAYNAKQRVGDVVEFCPDAVVLLIGTNDVNAVVNDSLTDRYIEKKELPQKPDKAFFVQSLELIIQKLDAVVSSNVVLVTLPVLGEDLEDESNTFIDDYNIEIRRLVSQHGLTLVELNREMKEALKGSDLVMFRKLSQGRGLMFRALMKRYFLLRSWDTIGDSYGLHLLTDTIHINGRGGRILRDLVKRELISIEKELRTAD